MATTQINFKQSDGQFTKQMDPNAISWGNYSFGGNESNQLYKADIGDVLTDVIGIDSGSKPFKYFDVTNQTWRSPTWSDRYYIDNAFGYNIVLANDYIYIAKDDEIEKIPDYVERTLYISRIKDPITKQNVDNYQSLSDSSGHYRTIPIGLLTTNQGSSYRFTTIIGLTHYIDGADNRLAVYKGLSTTSSNQPSLYNSGGIPFPNVQHYWKAANTTIQDMDTRLTLLEGSVADINSRLSAIEKTVGDLPAIVSAVSANVSKNYVAR